MVGKKQATGGQGEKQSAVVQQFASGFVARTADSDAQKAEQRAWDRSQLLGVKDDDTQVNIYNAYAHNANTDSEGKNTRRGLGAGGGGGACGGRGRTMSFVSAGGAPASTAASGMSFVSAGGAPASTPASTGYSTPGFVAAGGGGSGAFAGPSGVPAPNLLPAGWVVQHDPSSGYPYYVNMSTGVTQWEWPAAAPPMPAAPAAPVPPATPSLPPGWVSAVDPASGRAYYYNAASGVTQWEPPAAAAAATLAPPLPVPAPPLPSVSSAAAPAPAAADDRWRSGQGADSSVRVGGVPPDMSDLDLRELFAPCGTIVKFEVSGSVYSSSSTPRTASIRFDTPASAENAVKQMDGAKLRSHTLKVMLEVQRARSAAKPY